MTNWVDLSEEETQNLFSDFVWTLRRAVDAGAGHFTDFQLVKNCHGCPGAGRDSETWDQTLTLAFLVFLEMKGIVTP